MQRKILFILTGAFLAMVDWLTNICSTKHPQVYCWRCGKFVRALNELEYARFEAKFAATKCAMNEALDRGELNSAREVTILKSLKELCRELSGDDELEPSHLFKHRASAFGPPCEGCGRNLRTKRATRCMSCGREKKT
jgi:hypothetical protein